MTTKVALKNLKVAEEVLSKIAKAPLPGRLAVLVASLLRVIATQLGDLETARIALVKKHGIEDAEGNWTISPDNEEAIAAFREDFTAALEVEAEITPLSDTILDNISLTPSEAMLLEPLIEKK